MLQRFFQRFGAPICLGALLCWPLLLHGVKGAFDSNTNNVLDWLPAHFEETSRLVWFVERFGSDEILVVSWPGCTLDDERLDRFGAAVTRPIDVGSGVGPTVWFDRVFTGRQVLADLQSEPLRLTSRVARHRMRGWLVGPDGKTTCAVVLVSEAGMADRTAAVQAVYASAEACGLALDELRVAGPTADADAIDRASQRWVSELTLLAVFCSMLVAWWCLRTLHLVAGVFLAASFAWGLSLSAVYYSSTNMDAVLLMMPGLVFVLGVSGAVHLTHYYTDGLRECGPGQATGWAISRGWLPCSLACITTAIGLGSLALSHIRPIAKFGVFSAIGVMAVMATLLTLWPAAVAWWTSRRAGRAVERAEVPQRTGASWWRPLYLLATRHSSGLLVLTALILPALVLGVSRLGTSAKLEDLLPERSELIQGYLWFQESIGPLVPVEIVLRFEPREPADAADLMRRAQMVEELRRRIDAMENLGGTTAATTFIARIPEGGSVREVARRGIIAGRLRENRDTLIQMRYLADDGRAELWRISTRAEALVGVDYGKLLERLNGEVQHFLETQRRAAPIDVSAKISGGVPLIYMAQEQLLRDLVRSFLTAFGIIAVVMAVLMRSPTAGLVSMIPNVFPAIFVFGAMGLARTAVDIGAMMTASAALGIAADDTLHFLVWFRRGSAVEPTRREAIRYAYRHCATPMLKTTLICGLGLLVFALSPFKPTARFAWLMAILLSLALVADLILLPALLASPLGRCFVCSARQQAPNTDELNPEP